MYDIFEKLLKKYGVTAYRVAKDTGISTATLTQWKKGKSIPKQDKLQKIADYFNISIDYLLGREEITRIDDIVPPTNRVKELIKEKKISLKQLSDILKIPYVNLEVGIKNTKKLNLVDIIKLSKFFEVTTDYLFGVTDKRDEYFSNQDYFTRGFFDYAVKELIEIKKEKNITNEQLAINTKLQQKTVEDIFNNNFERINISELEAIANNLGYSLYELENLHNVGRDPSQEIMDMVSEIKDTENLKLVYDFLKKLNSNN
nr:helix-turn-helix domain-containing protein [Sedimentibacter sp.]